MLTLDDIISLHKACEDVIESEQRLDDVTSLEGKVAVLRSSVRTLAVIQRDLLKAILNS